MAMAIGLLVEFPSWFHTIFLELCSLEHIHSLWKDGKLHHILRCDSKLCPSLDFSPFLYLFLPGKNVAPLFQSFSCGWLFQHKTIQ